MTFSAAGGTEVSRLWCFVGTNWALESGMASHVPLGHWGLPPKWRSALVSGRLFRDYLRGADVPPSDPIYLPYKHVKFAWYEKRSPGILGYHGIPLY